MKVEDLQQFENGVRVATFEKLEKDLPHRLTVSGLSIGFKYTDQPQSCVRCSSMDHVVKNCPLKRRKNTKPAKTVNNPPSPADNNNADPNLDREDQTQSDLDALHQNGPDLPENTENTAQPKEVKTLPETTATSAGLKTSLHFESPTNSHHVYVVILLDLC
jgi:hypothetical protein